MARQRGYSDEKASEIALLWKEFSGGETAAISKFAEFLEERGTRTDISHKSFDNNALTKIVREAGYTNLRTRGAKSDDSPKPAKRAVKASVAETPSQLSLLVAAFKPSVAKPEAAPKSDRHAFALKLNGLELEVGARLAELEAEQTALMLSLNHLKRLQEMNSKEERSVETLAFMLANPGQKTPEESAEDAEAVAAVLDTSESQVSAETVKSKKGKK